MLTRRHFLGSIALPVVAAESKPGVPRPNIVLILADRLPYWMLGCYGNREVRTPYIDRLAQTGVRLASHYAAAPAPAEGRAGLLSGRLAGTGPSLANILQNAGYACGESKLGPEGLAPASDFLHGAGQNPFFLRVDAPAIEPPYAGIPQKHLDRYANSDFPTFIPPAPAAANAREGQGTPADPLPALRRVAAAITAIDEYVGKLLTELDKASPSGDTIVVFTSSCGALLGRHGLWGAGDSSDPVNMFEEAICTPMVWRWPKRLPPLTSRPELFSALDLVPAIIEATGAPPVQGLCGRSYLQVIAGKPLPKNQAWRNVVFAHYENTDMVRDTRYKLVWRDGGKGSGELYDLQTDRLERINRYDDPGFVTVRAGLAREIVKWKESCPAQQK